MSPRSWPPGRPRVLVTDAWLANAGDGAIALATQARLERLAPDAAVLHAAYQSDLVAAHYPELDLVAPLDALLGLFAVPELEGWPEEAARALVAEADAVLVQGGGFLLERYAPTTRLMAYAALADLDVPFAFGAQSIGPFREARHRALLARALRRAEAVGVRDEASARNVLELTGEDTTIAAADEAFGLFATPPDPAGDPRGLAVVMTSHPDLGGAVEPAVELVAELAALVPGEPLTLLSTTQGLGDADRGLEDDGELARAIAERVPAASVAAGYLAPAEFVARITAHRALVSQRMHPVIFALSRGVPAVLAMDDFKAGALDALGAGPVTVGRQDVAGIAAAARRALDAPASERGAALWERLAPARAAAAAGGDEVAGRLLRAASLGS